MRIKLLGMRFIFEVDWPTIKYGYVGRPLIPKTKQIVINECYGGFGLSDKAIERYAELKGITLEQRNSKWITNGHDYYQDGKLFTARDLARDDKVLIQVVYELKEEANDWASYLKIVEIPGEVDWQIQEYDGSEWISEKHRTWS